MGKGSKRRPPTVSDKIIEDNWQRIFGKRKHDKSVTLQDVNHHEAHCGILER